MARVTDPAAAFLGAVAAAAAQPGEGAPPIAVSSPAAKPTGAERLALSVDEAAAALGVDRRTVYAAVHSGELPGRRLGRRIVIGRDVLAAWFRGEL